MTVGSDRTAASWTGMTRAHQLPRRVTVRRLLLRSESQVFTGSRTYGVVVPSSELEEIADHPGTTFPSGPRLLNPTAIAAIPHHWI